MQFIDKAKIYIEAGKGGDGTVETVEKVEVLFLKQQHLYQRY